MDIEFEVTDPGLVDAYIQLCQQAPEFVNKVTNDTVNVIAPMMLADFQQEPGPIKLPVHWTSEKQRHYVMWAKRMGLIPSPYVRTHALSKGWHIVVTYRPGAMTTMELANAAPEAVFVVGYRRQIWHRETGWYSAGDKAAEWGRIFMDEMERALIKAFYAVGEGVR